MHHSRASLIPAALALFLGLAGPGRGDGGAPETAVFLHDYYAAYSARDAAGLAAFYAPEATFDDPSFELALRGPEQIRKLLEIALAKYEALEFEVAHTLSSGRELAVEGTMVGHLRGKVARVRFVSVFEFADGKIAAQRDMFDVLHFYTQLGVVPLQFRPKAPAEAAKGAKTGG